MATLADLGKEYASYILRNSNSPQVVSEIVNRINSLTYTSNGNLLSGEDKNRIIKTIETELLPSGRMNIKEGEDVSSLLSVINRIKKLIK